MIALDTNVLVRYLVRDILEQAEAARDLLERLTPEAPGFISREVTIETALMILAAAERVGATPLYTFDQTLARADAAVLVETTGA